MGIWSWETPNHDLKPYLAQHRSEQEFGLNIVSERGLFVSAACII